MARHPLQQAIESIDYFRRLRPDERLRATTKFDRVELAEGQVLPLSPESPRWIVVAEGEVDLAREGSRPIRMFMGDHWGETEVLAGQGETGQVRARTAAVIATLDRTGLQALLAEFPVVAVPLLTFLSKELKWHNDLLREINLARAQGLRPDQLRTTLRARKWRVRRRTHSPVRRLGAVLWTTLVTAPASRPAFWMFLGAALALAGARSVVAFILHNNLQKRLFALIGGKTGNPIHVHHFNYGLILIAVAGVLSLLPTSRRALRLLAFVLGVGIGLVVDEFALFWNLNPDYYQPSSRLAAAILLFLLVQVVYFRGLYLSAVKRLVVRGQS